MKNSHYVSIIAVLLCAGMTGPLWIARMEAKQADRLTEVGAPETGSSNQEQLPAPALTPAPEEDTRLACGLGIISRLRNRGDRCVPVAQPYAYQQPYAYPQRCAPAVPYQPYCAPQPQIYAPAPQASIPFSPGTVSSGCKCGDCCKTFTLRRWCIVPYVQEVQEDYVDCEVETSRFCEANCDQNNDCIETIGIQNRKKLIVKSEPRKYTLTKLEQCDVQVTKCIKCGCIRDQQISTQGNYGTQRPISEPTFNRAPVLQETKFKPVLRQSQLLNWKDPEEKK